MEKRINTKIQAVIDSSNKALEGLRKFDADSAKYDEGVNKAIEQLNKNDAELKRAVDELIKKCD